MNVIRARVKLVLAARGALARFLISSVPAPAVAAPLPVAHSTEPAPNDAGAELSPTSNFEPRHWFLPLTVAGKLAPAAKRYDESNSSRQLQALLEARGIRFSAGTSLTYFPWSGFLEVWGDGEALRRIGAVVDEAITGVSSEEAASLMMEQEELDARRAAVDPAFALEKKALAARPHLHGPQGRGYNGSDSIPPLVPSIAGS